MAFEGDKTVVVAAGTHDDTVVGTEVLIDFRLPFGVETDILNGIVVVAGGLKVTYTLYHTGFHFREMTGITYDACQLTGQRVEGSVKDKVAAVFMIDALVATTGGEHKEEHADNSIAGQLSQTQQHKHK